jgi:hypothetical protein
MRDIAVANAGAMMEASWAELACGATDAFWSSVQALWHG